VVNHQNFAEHCLHMYMLQDGPNAVPYELARGFAINITTSSNVTCRLDKHNSTTAVGWRLQRCCICARMERAPFSLHNQQQHQQQHQQHQTKWLLQHSRPLQQTWCSCHSSRTHPASENTAAAEVASAAAAGAAAGCNKQSYTSIVGSTLPAQHSSLLYLHPALQDRHGQCVLQERSLNSLQDAPRQYYSSRDQQPKQQLQDGQRRVSVVQPEQLHSAMPQQQQLLPALQHTQHTQQAAVRHSSEQFADCASSCSRMPLHGRTLQAGAGAAPSTAAAGSAGVAAAIAAASARLHSLLGYTRPCRNSSEPSAEQQQQNQQQQGRTLALSACRTAAPVKAAQQQVPSAVTAAAATSSDDLCMCDEQFSDPCSVMGCYGSLDANAFLSEADSAADMELDDAADSARPAHQHQHQQQQRTLQWLVASSSSMGAQELAQATAAAVTGDCSNLLCHSNSKDAAAEFEHAGIMQTLLQQVLNKAAVQRKRAAVLQAGAEAGSRSVRVRLLITELAVYSSTGKPLAPAVPWLRSVGPPISCGCSAADLSLSNRLMSSIKLPGE
jgi:hypothetical protein